MTKTIALFCLALSFYLFLFNLSPSHAEPAKALMADTERLFLEEKYDKVVSRANHLIDSRAANRDEVYYLKGLSLLKLKRFNEARESFEKIASGFQVSKRAFDAHIGIGDSYFLEENLNAAIKIYEDTLTRFHNDKNAPLVYHRLAMCHKKAGSGAKAAGYFNKLREAAPSSFEARMTHDLDERPTGTVKHSKPIPGEWYFSVQVGSFRNKTNAERLADKLSRKNYESFVEAAKDSGETLYRVKVGRYSQKEDAKKTASRLKSLGYGPRICTYDLCQ